MGKAINRSILNCYHHFAMNDTRVNITSLYLSWAPPELDNNYVAEVFVGIIGIILLMLILLRFIQSQLKRDEIV